MGWAGAGLWAAHMRHGAALALEPAHRLCQRQELRHSWGDITRIIMLLQKINLYLRRPRSHKDSHSTD